LIIRTIIISLFFVLLSAQQAVMANRMYVFYPTDIRPKKMEKHISKHCPEIKTIVFGKVKDFEEQTHRAPPDAILSFTPVINKNKHFSNPYIQGIRNELTHEKFVLVSMNKAIEVGNLNSQKIGVLDILGRRPMTDFIRKMLGAKVKLSRVTKTEDILNLLTFGFVDAIFVSQYRYEKYSRESQLPLVATDLNIKMDLVALAVNNEASKNLFFKCVNRLDSDTNALLGVDKWQLK